jgi:CHAT domain-containing protein
LLAMWNVDRISSTTMVRLFYENWLIHKLPKWKALANAQLQIFQDEQHPAWSHFYHWGALQLIGV